MLNHHRLSAPAKSAPATSLAQNSRFGLVLSTVKYLLRTEVHTFAFSVAANAILSFFPFVLLLMTIIRRVFHSTVMYETVLQLLRDFLPVGQEFVIRNLNALVGARAIAPFCAVCEPDVLGVSLGIVAADRRASLGPAARQNIAFFGFSRFGKVYPSHPSVTLRTSRNSCFD